VVGYRYLIKDERGQVLAASTELVHSVHGGANSLPQGIENDMLGRIRGETFTAMLSTREAFGPPGAKHRVTLPQDRLPKTFGLALGTRIDLRAADGDGFTVWVDGSDSMSVTVGLDHPFAGSSIQFEISIVSIRSATADEQHE
jgi:FKBP-type peptidyl-prolyl cis-trans isomerase SlyD